MRVVLDANVLYGLPLRDTLLSLAEAGLYEVRWSQRILDEAFGSLLADGRIDGAQRRGLEAAMADAFRQSMIPAACVDPLIPLMPNHASDRHVLAAAVASNADSIVTMNLGHFVWPVCGSVGVEVKEPDRFLVAVFEAFPDEVIAVLTAQAGRLRKPALATSDLVGRLSLQAPRFARLAEAALGAPRRA